MPAGASREELNGPGGPGSLKRGYAAPGAEVWGFPLVPVGYSYKMLGELVFERGAVSRRTSETKRACITK